MDAMTKGLIDLVQRIAQSNTVYKSYAIELLKEHDLPIEAKNVNAVKNEN